MKKILIPVICAIALCSPAANAQFNIGRLMQGGAKLIQAATLSDAQVIAYIKEYIADSDSKNKVAPDDSPYTIRLAKLTQGLTSVEGIPLNFKVYLTDEVNAFACADGSVRVYSGLMDTMTDNEVLGVIGHEIGHVAHKDSKNAFKQALVNSALKDGIASTNGTVAALTDSQLGKLGDALATAKFSQKQENNADDYGYDFLKSNGKNPAAMVFAFQKLQQLEKASGSTQNNPINQLFSSHPEIEKRIGRMEKRCQQDGYSLVQEQPKADKPTSKTSSTKKSKSSKSSKKSSTSKSSKTSKTSSSKKTTKK